MSSPQKSIIEKAWTCIERWRRRGYKGQVEIFETVMAQLPKWQPIETAPQGKILLFYFEDLNLASVGYYDPDFLAWVSIDTDEPYETTPTHWVPLPEPPK